MPDDDVKPDQEQASAPEGEEQQDVQAEETPVDQSSDQEVESQEEQSQEESTPQESLDALDPSGVPWKNRAMEWQRKNQETAEALPSLIEEAIKKNLPQQGQQGQREYTISELEQFASQNPEYKPWVEEQKAKLLEKQFDRRLEERLTLADKARSDAVKKQQAEQYVLKNFPDMFIKDQSGRPMQWDENHPMTREFAKLMNDPKFASDPEGMALAAEIANSRYMRNKVTKVSKENKNLKTQVKKAQKGVLVEGQGKQDAQSKTSVRKAIDSFAQSGRKQDAERAVSEYLRATGFIKE